MSTSPFWKGSRGEWYLVVQGVLFLLLLFGPRTFGGIPVWSAPFTQYGSLCGGVLLLAGALLATAGVVNLGKNLTPLPTPKRNASLIISGAFRLVRHPIYSGIIIFSFGWGLWLNSWPVIGYALLLLIFFDIKSRYEERLLLAKFQEYALYRTRVKKLIPFIY